MLLLISLPQNALSPLITPLLTEKLPAISNNVCLCDG
jgi:hypothetical protein